MSNRPDNPFQNSGPGTMYGDQQPKTGGSKVWLWVLGSIGAVVLLGALVCCGGGYFAYQAGTGMIAEAYIEQLRGNPVIEEHIGDIESMNFDLSATTEHAEASGGAMAFKIEGTKGSGILLVQQAAGGDGKSIENAELLLPDGTRHGVPIAGQPAPDADEPLEVGDEPAVDEPALDAPAVNETPAPETEAVDAEQPVAPAE